MANTRVVTAPLPVEMAEQVDAWTDKNGRSRSWLIKEAVGQFLEREAERDSMIRAVLSEVDTGQLISHEDMVACVSTPRNRTIHF